MTLRARVDVGDSLTFGDLYQFVDLARASGVSAETQVVQVPVREGEPDLGIDCFEVELATSARIEQARTLAAADTRALAAVLDAVVQAEGDARNVLNDLQAWRDRLVST